MVSTHFSLLLDVEDLQFILSKCSNNCCYKSSPICKELITEIIILANSTYKEFSVLATNF